MIEHRLGNFVEALLPLGVAGGFHPHKHLQLQFDGRERVLQIVRYAAGHIGPGFVALHLGQAAGTFSQVLHHTVIGLHQRCDFVFLIIVQRLQMVHIRNGHLPAQFRDGTEHTAYHRYRDEAGEQQEQQEDGDDRGDMQDGLAFQIVRDVGERGRDNGHQVTSAVHHRRIKGVIASPAHALHM